MRTISASVSSPRAICFWLSKSYPNFDTSSSVTIAPWQGTERLCMSSVLDSLVRLAPRSSCHTTSLVSLWMSGVGTACLVVCEICSIYIPDWILSPLAEAISKPGVRFSSSPTQASNSVQSFSATTANGSNCLDQFKVFRCLWNLVS
jgi:hypothetical protein